MSIRAYAEERWYDLRLWIGSRSSSLWMKLAAVILAVLLLYYPVGMLIVHKVDDSTAFQPPVEKGQSHAVAIARGLIEREVEQYRWTSMDPFFMPGALLDNMPNYQQGMMAALSRFSIEMADQIGRVRGSSQVDEDLDRAVGFLKYKPDIWFYDVSESWLPQRSSAEQYRHGAEALARYNARLAEGNAVYERRADNLLATLDRFAADIGSASAVTHSALEGLTAFSWSADDVFYKNKGRLYGYYMLLKGLKADYERVIQEKQLGNAWDQMLDSLRRAVEMDPVLVINGSPDGVILPSHLAGQGFYLLRARTQLREITNVLLK